MDSVKAIDTRKIAFNGSSSVEEDFGKLCTGVTLTSDEDCHVDFDGPADTGGFLVKANSNTGQIKCQFTKLSVIGASGTGNLYVLATRT